MSRKPSKPETRIEDYLDVMTGGNAALPQPILRIEFYYAFLAGMTVELPQPILDDEKLLAKICGMEVEAPTYIPGISPRLYAYMAKKGGQDVQVPDPILRLECYWYDYSAGEAPSVQEYTGAVPVTFIADGTPLLDYIISGNTVQSGTPTPDNPIMPQGTGERTGNLFDIPDIVSTGYYVIDTDKLYPAITSLKAERYYTLSWDYLSNGTTGVRNQLRLRNDYGTIKTIQSGESFTLTQSDISNATDIVAYFGSNATGGSMKHFMLNEGSQPLPYEPYGQYKIPILSANTTTPVYLGEVESTRKVKKYECTGDENWWFYSDSTGEYGTWQFYVDNVVNGLPLSSALSNVADYGVIAATRSRYPYGVYLVTSGTGIAFQTAGAKDMFPNVAAWKSYLAQQYAAGAPVTVWYVLATEETGIVNEPLMRIGDYSDTLSMEQAGVSIPTANGSTTLDVETTVPPSEIYIKYRGEAVATLSALSAEVISPEAATEEKNPEEMEEEENER